MKRVFILFLILVNCGGMSSNMEREGKLKEAIRELDRLESELESISVRMGESIWASYENRSGERIELIMDDFRSLIKRAKPIVELLSKRGIEDPVLKRRVEVWSRIIEGSRLLFDREVTKLSSSIEKRINNYRFKVDGKELTRSDLIKMYLSDDKETRKKAYFAELSLHREVLADTLRLIRLRKELAKKSGLPSYSEAILKLRGIEPDWLSNLFNRLLEETEPAYKKILDDGKKRLKLKEIRPWDIYYIQKKGVERFDESLFKKGEAIAALKTVLEKIGFKFKRLPFKLIERDFGYGGQTIAIKIPEKVYMAINPFPGLRYWEILFHETGHALQAVFTEIPYPVLKGYEWWLGGSCGAFSEGMAELIAYFIYYPEVLKEIVGLDKQSIDRLLKYKAINDLFYLRRGIANSLFEIELYRIPEEEIDKRYIEIMERVRGIKYSGVEEVNWASSSFISAYPIYRQNYVIADIIASNIHNFIKERFGGLNKEIADWLIKSFYKDGELIPWYEKVKRAIKHDLIY